MKTFEIEVNGVKTQVEVEFYNVFPAGYGHYSICGVACVGRDKLNIKATTNNMGTIDAYNSGRHDDDMEELNRIKSEFEEFIFFENFDKITEHFNELAAYGEQD